MVFRFFGLCPLSLFIGATPNSLAISFRLRSRSSGSSAKNVWMATGPIPLADSSRRMSYGKPRRERRRAFDQQMIKRSCASLTHSALEFPCQVASPLTPLTQATTSLFHLCSLNTRHASENLGGGWGGGLHPLILGKISTCLLTTLRPSL